MQNSTLQGIIQAFNAASNDATRYHINFVYLTAEGGRVRIRATEGHLLADFSTDDAETAKLIGDKTFAVSPDSLPGFKAIAKAYKNMPEVHCELGASNRLAIGKSDISGLIVEVKTDKEAGVECPDTRGIWPRYTEEPVQIGLNAEYLLSLLKAMREDKRQVNVKLVIKDKSAPILVKVGNREGLLMPVRIDTKTYCEPVKVEESA